MADRWVVLGEMWASEISPYMSDLAESILCARWIAGIFRDEEEANSWMKEAAQFGLFSNLPVGDKDSLAGFDQGYASQHRVRRHTVRYHTLSGPEKNWFTSE